MFYLVSADSSYRVSITEHLGTAPTTYRLCYSRAKISFYFVLLNFTLGKLLNKHVYTAQKRITTHTAADIAGMPAAIRISTTDITDKLHVYNYTFNFYYKSYLWPETLFKENTHFI